MKHLPTQVLLSAKQLFDALWCDYIQVYPMAKCIRYGIAKAAGLKPSQLINDHIALRTFNVDPIGIDHLEQHFLNLGYEQAGEYHFAQKQLYARHYVPCKDVLGDNNNSHDVLPKVFLSELKVGAFSSDFQRIVNHLVDCIDKVNVTDPSFLYSGRPWPISIKQYKTLLNESDYAAWLAIWGYRANHFTIRVNELPNLQNLNQVNQVVESLGYALNLVGGAIKGDPSVGLEQSSTLAGEVVIELADGSIKVPSCFYEFALRHKINGKLYEGFVTQSADRIFQSTDLQK
ncbi:DUF1338 domain-containing protein [Saccharobesus litoralis]|uniref:2-oxoadipate dioxygenase/decarboxylase n=1 Tax=Saccharobesus litoralis TaxID=2172099 RepID=A0A2S0VT00_9ALTE|nr:DUF1338 domain-containing protein [Saccharobesus litoralis]AWB67313.1 DUF1338 domain-containing protein [Saccharobesus litoralis]